MRKTFLTKGFVRFSRGLAGAALIAAAIGITSCETHSNSDRNESIKVYADPIAKEPIDAGIVGVKGGLAKLYVDANIDFVATWEDDAATPWAKVVDYSSTDPQTGLRVITLKANRRSTTSSYYTRRTGMLILAASDGELNYNRIIPIHQGSTARVSNDFATLKYGKTDPRFTDGETPIDNWTTAQKNLGFTSTTIEGEEVAHCYGKNGYLKLGDLLPFDRRGREPEVFLGRGPVVDRGFAVGEARVGLAVLQGREIVAHAGRGALVDGDYPVVVQFAVGGCQNQHARAPRVVARRRAAPVGLQGYHAKPRLGVCRRVIHHLGPRRRCVVFPRRDKVDVGVHVEFGETAFHADDAGVDRLFCDRVRVDLDRFVTIGVRMRFTRRDADCRRD